MKIRYFLFLFLLIVSCQKEKLNFNSFEIIYHHGWATNYSILINNSDSILIEVKQILPKEHRNYINKSDFYKLKVNDTLIQFLNKNIRKIKGKSLDLFPPDAPLISFKILKNKKELYFDDTNKHVLIKYFQKQIDSFQLEKTEWRYDFYNPVMILPNK